VPSMNNQYSKYQKGQAPLNICISMEVSPVAGAEESVGARAGARLLAVQRISPRDFRLRSHQG